MTTAQVAQDKESIKSEILQSIVHADGRIVVYSGKMEDAQKTLGVRCSRRKFRQAINSLVHHGALKRYRRQPQYNGDIERPVTFSVPGMASGGVRTSSTFAR